MKTLLIGERYREKLEKHLILQDFSPIWLPDNPLLDKRLSPHTDLSVFKYNDILILGAHLGTETIVNNLTNRGYRVKICGAEQSCAYPKDVNLCAALIGNKVLHNSNYTDPEILALGLENIYVKQGYARCTALIIDDKSIITADNGIASAAKRCGIDVLLISDEGIILDGFDKGFIGGASFMAGDTVYFIGDINRHPDGAAICEFIQCHGVNYCSLTKNPCLTSEERYV